MSCYREILSDSDLILQRKVGFLFGKWVNWRNLDEELRALRLHEKSAEDHYKQMQYLRTIAEGNIRDRKEMLQVHLMDNSDAAFNLKVETSILEQRDGVKYNFGKQGNQNPKQQQKGGGNNNQKQQQNGQNNQGNKSSGNGRKPLVISMQDLLGAKVSLN